MTLALDHIVVAVRDLDRASESYRKLFGLAPSWRGRHPAYCTANVLFRLPDCYIELLAPDNRLPSPSGRGVRGEGDPPPWLRALSDHLDRTGEGLYAIALGTGDIAATVATARARGLTVEDPGDGSGVDLITGAGREWTNARIDPRTTRGVRAFFIQHGSPGDARPLAQPESDRSSCVASVDQIVVASSDLDATLRLWRETLGLDLRRTIAWSPERTLHFLRLGATILELAGSPAPTKDHSEPVEGRPSSASSAGGAATGDNRTSDQQPATREQLWGVSYRVDDVARTVDRLREHGIDVSDARAGRALGTVVADLKRGFSHEVRTLFIQK